MRFMFLVTQKRSYGPPPKALMDAMEQGRAELSEGAMIMTGGLAPAAQSARAKVERGRLTVTDGPFAEGKELVGGYAIMEIPSMAEAIEATKWLMETHMKYWPEWEGEVDVRPMFEMPR